MRKSLLIGLTVLLVLALAIPAYAAITDAQKKEILDIHKQMMELRKKMIDKYVDAGQITAEQGKTAKERIDQMEKYRTENGILPGQGMAGGCGGGGCGGGGCGTNGGFGGKGLGGGMMRGWNAQTQSL